MPSHNELEPLKAGQRPPAYRIKDANSASRIDDNLAEAQRKRLNRWTMVDRMFDGGPPFQDAALRAAGQASRSNVNTMEGKAFLSAATTPYYDLFRSAKTFVSIELDLEDRARAIDVSRHVTEALHDELNSWVNFHFRMWSMFNDYTRHGRGFKFWSSTPDWRSRHVRHHRVFVPEGTEIDLETLPLVVVHQTLNATALYSRIREEDMARRAGWNPRMVRAAIEDAVDLNRFGSDNPVDIQDALRDNDLLITSSAKVVPLAHLFVREWDGSWTHMIIRRNWSKKNENEFLFRKRNAFKKAEHFIAPFFFEVMNGSWNGASGLGKDIYPLISHKDRIENALMDAVYLRTGVNLQATDASSLRRLSTVQIGGAMNVWPAGFNAINANVLGDMEGAMAELNRLDKILERNTGIYRPAVQKDQGNPATATEMQMRFNQAMVLQSSAIDRFYTQLDRYYAELWRRLTADSKSRTELMKRLKRTPVKESDLKAPAVVKATRASGSGSPALRQQAVFALSGLAGSFPEKGRQRWLDDAIAVTAGQDKVTLYNPKPPEREQPDQHMWEAMSENADLSEAKPVVRYPSQNDLIHLQTHLTFASQSAGQLQRGADPMKVLTILDNVGRHSAVHLQAMGQDELRQDDVKQLQDVWDELAKTADKLRRQLQQQQQEQARAAQQSAQNGQQLSEEQLKAQQKQAMAAQEMELKQAKAQQDMEINRAKALNDIELRRAQAQANIQEDLATKEQ